MFFPMLRRRSALLLLPALLPCLLAGTARPLPADDPGPPQEEKSIELVIDFGDGFQKRYAALTVTAPATVLDVMRAAEQHPRGIEFKFRGRGARALLTRIDDLENEGTGRNWIYRVNGELADRSFAVFAVKPGDRVLWKFDEYR